MKILFLSNVFPPGFIGGYELGALEIACDLSSKGHEVHVLTSDYFLDDESELDGITVHRILDWRAMRHDLPPSTQTYASFVVWRNIRAIMSEIRKFNPDLIMCFNIEELGQFSIVAMLRHLNIPTVHYYMDNVFKSFPADHPWVTAFEQIFGRNDLGKNASAVFMSRNLQQQILPHIGPVLDETHFIPGWITDAIFDQAIERSPGKDETRFVFSSRIAPHKGTEVLIEAVRLLLTEDLPPFSVDVYGSGQVTSFVQRCVTHGVDSRIRYCGSLPKEEMLTRFYGYHALLFPTWPREPYGFVASEAAATGCVPVLTHGIGAAEWFLDGVDCFKISQTPQSLADAMRKIIVMSGDELAVYSANAVRSSKNNLRMSMWMEQIEQLAINQVARHQGPRNDSYGVQSSILALMELWKERCGINW